MFIELANFGYRRTPTQAIGFYIAYLIVSVVVAGMFGGVISLFSGNPDSLGFSVFVSRFFEAGICAILGYLVIVQKNRSGNYRDYSIAVLSTVFAFVLGGLVGLVGIAYLTTLQVAKRH